jgi:hypothetical protein
MPRTLELRDDGLAVSFRGLVRLGTLRRRLVVPWSAVQEVVADPYVELEPSPLAPVAPRLSRAAHGRFRRAGRWLFLSFENPCRVVRLRLDRRAGGGFDEIVLGHPEPAALAAAIAARAGLGLSPAARAA